MKRRQRRIIMWVVGAVIGLVVAAAVAWAFRVPLLRLLPSPPVVITDQDNGRIVNILQGQTLEVHLRGNRFSGYRWFLGVPISFLQQTGDVTFTEDATPAHPGDGSQSLSFRAIAPGMGPLFLGYLPETNQNSDQPSKSFRVVVAVQ
jgi:predicted secreted protein